MGAAITHLTLFNNGKQREVISFHSGYHYQSSLLFPFPNRLKNGAFDFEGKTYQFPLNDFGLPNALHGFVHDRKFELEEQKENSLALKYSSSGDFECYPFPFDLNIKYELEPGQLRILVSIINTGKSNLPYGFGWHPYFNIKEGIDQPELGLKNVELIEVDDIMVPTGEKVAYKNLEDSPSLKEIKLDTCFQFLNTATGNKVSLSFADQSTLEIWQDENMPFVQVFTPPDQKTIAIEPMTSNIDVLNSGDGIRILNSGEEESFNFGVKFI